jgi:hypothetical protein
MPFNLSQFRSSINNNGIAKTNTYEVIIGVTSSLQNIANVTMPITSELTLRCQSIQLPEIDLMTLPYYPKVIGGGERRVVGINQFKVIPMEFIVDTDMRIVQFFQNWLQGIVNYYSPPGDNYRIINENQLPYELSYRDEYAVQITINVYPQGMVNGDETPQIYKLFRAFPINMGNITLSYGDENKHMILPIGFTYDSIEASGLKIGVNLGDIAQSNKF